MLLRIPHAAGARAGRIVATGCQPAFALGASARGAGLGLREPKANRAPFMVRGSKPVDETPRASARVGESEGRSPSFWLSSLPLWRIPFSYEIRRRWPTLMAVLRSRQHVWTCWIRSQPSSSYDGASAFAPSPGRRDQIHQPLLRRRTCAPKSQPTRTYVGLSRAWKPHWLKGDCPGRLKWRDRLACHYAR
jgi:hypothetical protein